MQFRERQEEQERRMWQEKMEAELEVTRRKLQLEKGAQTITAKLPKFKITPFKGTPTDWIRFRNMFVTQVHDKEISEEEKFGYLLEMVSPKVRDKIANLKPGAMGYKIAWERLEKEFGQTKRVINAHMQQIINIPTVRGSNYIKMQEFYETVSKNHDVLLTLGEANMLRGFVMATLDKLPQVKPDLVRTDEDWENWDMGDLIDALQKWLRRNATEDRSGDCRKSERHWFTPTGNSRERGNPVCIFCEGNHWGDGCQLVNTLEERRKVFHEKRLCYNCGRPGHREKQCRSRGCFKCKGKHHTSICDRIQGRPQNESETVMTTYTPSVEEKSLPAVIPVIIKGKTFWAYLDNWI